MTELPPQYVLDLPHRAALDGEDFWVSECHHAVTAWLDVWQEWSAPGLVVVGPPRGGKTHLARIFAHETGAVVATASELGDGARLPAPGARALIVEDIDRNPDEMALFHLYNRAREAGVSLLFTSRVQPAQITLSLADWRSRLLTCAVAQIGRPDDRLMAAVLAKLFHDRQLVVGEEEVAYLLTHMERAIAVAETVVAESDRRALAQKRKIGVPILKETLEALSRG